jgi:hypothetical protein
MKVIPVDTKLDINFGEMFASAVFLVTQNLSVFSRLISSGMDT